MGLRALIEQVGHRLSGHPTELAWWARGDTPVRVAETLVPLVDGRAAMLAMCIAFLTAQERIWLVDWDLQAGLEMVRGADQQAGEEGTPAQNALLARLRTAGLDEDALALWQRGQLRVEEVLGFAARRGVEVRMLLWDPWSLSRLLRIVNNPPHQKDLLKVEGVQVRLDKSSHSLFHVAQALHQKFSVIDGTTAFIGGVDLTVSADGDFNRWDTPAHRFESADRATDLGPSPHPWHDVHLRVTGPPAADVEHTFLQRWEEAAHPWWKRVSPPLKHLIAFALAGQRVSGQEAAREEVAGELPPGAGPPVAGESARVQVIRTIPALTYRFAPAGIYGIAQAYLLAIQRAKRFIYLESQYFWLERLLSLNFGLLGWQSHQVRALLEELAAAAERGVAVALVLPDHPNCGRSVTDSTIAWFRTHAPRAAAQGRLHFFTLATAEVRPRDRVLRYRPIYVHAKVGVVDDRWVTVGSANLNSRGVGHDAELNLAVLDDAFARGLRLSLWAEHLGLLDQVQTGWPAPATLPLPQPMVRPKAKGVQVLLAPVDLRPREGDAAAPAGGPDTWAALEDPLGGFTLLERRARENLEHLLRGEPLEGHLLPYLLEEEAKQCGLTVDRARGVLDPLRGLREGVAVRHPKHYT